MDYKKDTHRNDNYFQSSDESNDINHDDGKIHEYVIVLTIDIHKLSLTKSIKELIHKLFDHLDCKLKVYRIQRSRTFQLIINYSGQLIFWKLLHKKCYWGKLYNCSSRNDSTNERSLSDDELLLDLSKKDVGGNNDFPWE